MDAGHLHQRDISRACLALYAVAESEWALAFVPPGWYGKSGMSVAADAQPKQLPTEEQKHTNFLVNLATAVVDNCWLIKHLCHSQLYSIFLKHLHS